MELNHPSKFLIFLCFNWDIQNLFTKVTIEDPCTDGQRYTLGRDGLIVIKADGNKFFTGSCVVTLRAEDSHYQCSKLCFTVDSFKLQVCDLRLAFYDTGVWNYGAAPASWVSCGSNELCFLV